MKKLSLVVMVTLGLFLMAGVAFAVTATGTLNATATVSSTAKLSIGSNTMTFPDSDPDSVPTISATEGAISVTAKAKSGSSSSVTLEVKSSGDLISGSDSIAISNLKLSGAGTGFVAGPITISNSNQTAASWTGSGNRNGTQSFSLVNSWLYATGTYTATITYTLTAP